MFTAEQEEQELPNYATAALIRHQQEQLNSQQPGYTDAPGMKGKSNQDSDSSRHEGK